MPATNLPNSTELATSWPDRVVPDRADAGWWPWADRIGAGLSLGCALHCLLLPLLLLLAPLLQLGLSDLSADSPAWLRWFIWSHQVEWLISGSVIAFAGVVLAHGWWRHRQTMALRSYAAGALVLLLAVTEWIDLGLWHGLLLALGGGLIAWAHLTNLRLLRRYADACCPH